MENNYFLNNGKTEVNDRRTDVDKKEKRFFVTATDKQMSGWGGAKNGLSKCAWACSEDQVLQVYQWVNKRSEMKYVNIHPASSFKIRNCAHFSIYVVSNQHPALDN